MFNLVLASAHLRFIDDLDARRLRPRIHRPKCRIIRPKYSRIPRWPKMSPKWTSHHEIHLGAMFMHNFSFYTICVAIFDNAFFNAGNLEYEAEDGPPRMAGRNKDPLWQLSYLHCCKDEADAFVGSSITKIGSISHTTIGLVLYSCRLYASLRHQRGMVFL